MTLRELLVALVLGVVEGATEFIPVSSTGHLILVSDWLDFTGDRANTFVIFIQLGAILAIVWLYWRTFLTVAVSWPSSPESRRFLLNLAIAFVPAAVAGLLFHEQIKAYLFRPFTVACALVTGGILILVIERWKPATRIDQVGLIPPRTALGIGLAQMLALIPGVSRSGATIMGAYSLGLSRKSAAEFSFFLAVPVMGAATIYDLVDSLDHLTGADFPVFAVGFVMSFLAAVLVVRAFLTFISRHTFVGFAWYRIVFGLLLIAAYW